MEINKNPPPKRSVSCHRIFTDKVILLSTAINMPVIFVGPLEHSAVVFTMLMISRLVAIPVKFVAGLGNETTAPSVVFVWTKNVVQTKPASFSHRCYAKQENKITSIL